MSTPDPPEPQSSAPSASAPADYASDKPQSPTSGIDRLKLIGGLVALTAGLLALIVVVVVSLIVKPDTTGGSIATSAIGVIGSIVGAYFGVKIGTDGTQKAIQAQQQEATKAQVFALHVAPGDAATALAHVQTLIESQKAATPQ